MLSRRGPALWLVLPTMLIAATAAVGSCGGDDEDKVGDKCAEICALDDKHPCTISPAVGASENQCIGACKNKAGEAERTGFKGSACGLCIAALFEYSYQQCQGTDERCTYGGPNSPACEPLSGCSESDEKCLGLLQPGSASDPAGPCAAECIEPE